MIQLAAQKLFYRSLAVCLFLAASLSFGATPKPIYYCNDPDWFPIDYTTSNGQPKGVAVDLLNHLFTHYLPQYKLIHWPTDSWKASLKAFQKNKCQILAEALETPWRKHFILFSKPLLEYPLVFVTHKDFPAITQLSQLKGRTLARNESSIFIPLMKRHIPDLKVLIVPNTESAYALVAGKKADFTVDIAPVAQANLTRMGLHELILNGAPKQKYTLNIGISKHLPALHAALNQAITRMPMTERLNIQQTYFSSALTEPAHTKSSPSQDNDHLAQNKLLKILMIGAVLIVVLLIILVFWLQKRNKQHGQDALTKLYNRHAMAQRLPKLLKKAATKHIPLSVIVLDVDFFKRINDSLGHLIGDQVLAKLGELLKQHTPDNCTPIRWGGEEFVILCPSMSLEQSCKLAETLRQKVKQNFEAEGSLPNVTISLGVAQYAGEDSFDELLKRADHALYRAKRNGRDQVACSGQAAQVIEAALKEQIPSRFIPDSTDHTTSTPA